MEVFNWAPLNLAALCTDTFLLSVRYIVGKNLSSPLSLSDLLCAGQAAGFLTVDQVRELDLGHGEKPDYFNCKATITFCRKDNCLYKVCSVLPAVEREGEY